EGSVTGGPAGDLVGRGELWLLGPAVARHVLLDLLLPLADRGGDEVVVGVVGDAAVDGVAHDHGRLGRVEDDDGLAALGAADLLDVELGGLGELVDVGARAGTGGLGGDGRDDLGIPHRHDLRDGVEHGAGGLAAAGDQIVVGGVYVLAED